MGVVIFLVFRAVHSAVQNCSLMTAAVESVFGVRIVVQQNSRSPCVQRARGAVLRSSPSLWVGAGRLLSTGLDEVRVIRAGAGPTRRWQDQTLAVVRRGQVPDQLSVQSASTLSLTTK